MKSMEVRIHGGDWRANRVNYFKFAYEGAAGE